MTRLGLGLQLGAKSSSSNMSRPLALVDGKLVFGSHGEPKELPTRPSSSVNPPDTNLTQHQDFKSD